MTHHQQPRGRIGGRAVGPAYLRRRAGASGAEARLVAGGFDVIEVAFRRAWQLLEQTGSGRRGDGDGELVGEVLGRGANGCDEPSCGDLPGAFEESLEGRAAQV